MRLVVAIAMTLAAVSASHAEDQLKGVEYAANVIAPATRNICDSLLKDYATRFDPIYSQWAAARAAQIAKGKIEVAGKLGPGQTIEQFEEAAIWKNAQEFDSATSEKKNSKCVAFFDLFKSSLASTRPASEKSTQPPLRLSCALTEPTDGKKMDFIADVDFSNNSVSLNSKLTYPATISDSSIGWNVAIDGTNFYMHVNRYTGAIRYGNDEFPSIYSGICEKASDRRF